MAIGYIMIQTRTAHDAVPLSDVQIRILDNLGNLIYELTISKHNFPHQTRKHTIFNSKHMPKHMIKPNIMNNNLCHKT